MIPLFIRGSEHDPRTKIPTTDEGVPNRPIGHRPEPQVRRQIQPPFFMHFTFINKCSLPQQQQTAGAGITNINGQLNAQFGGMSFTAGFGFFPSLFGLQFQV